MSQGKLIELMNWKQAEEHFTTDAVIVIPLGAAAKEHGLHLQLRNDWLYAEYLKQQVLEHAKVLVLPTVNYAYYPAFVEYAGSISLSAETTTKMICEICTSVSKFGPKRFYVINTGISTKAPLQAAADYLYINDGILLKYTDLAAAPIAAIELEVSEQEGGSHADEIETSIMLYIAPETVEMNKAGKDFDASAQGPLSPNPDTVNCYSASGVWGDATLATKAKGEKVVKCLISHILQDIENLRSSKIN